MKQQGVLDFYFAECPEFVDLLDAIREKHEPQEYHQLSLFVGHILKVPMHEVGLVQLYLFNGRYDSSLYFPKVSVVTAEDIYAAVYPDKKAVYLSLMPDATKEDVSNFIETRWQEARQKLNENFPKRKRRTVKIERLNDWLEIADKVYTYTGGSKQRFYENLAINYAIPSTDIQAYAKTYRPLMELKHPSFESDVVNENV